jgi:hypothetical protein
VCDANRCRKDWFTALVAASNRSEAKAIPRKALHGQAKIDNKFDSQRDQAVTP